MHTSERLLHLMALGDKDAARELLRDARRRGDSAAQDAALRVIAPGLRADAQACDGDLSLCDADVVAFNRLEVVTGDLTLHINDAEHLSALSALRVVMGTLSLRGSEATGALSLPALGEVGGLMVEGNAALEEVRLRSLRVVHGDLTVRDNPTLRALWLADIFTVGGHFAATGPALVDISTPTPDPAAAAQAGGLNAEETQRLLDSFQSAAHAIDSARVLSKQRKSGLAEWAALTALGIAASVLMGYCSPPRSSWRDIPYPNIKIPPIEIPVFSVELNPSLDERLQRLALQVQPTTSLRPLREPSLMRRLLVTLTSLRWVVRALLMLTVRVDIGNNLDGMSPLRRVLCCLNDRACCNTTQAPRLQHPEGTDAPSLPD